MSADGNWSLCFDMKAPYLLDNTISTAKDFNDSKAVLGLQRLYLAYNDIFISRFDVRFSTIANSDTNASFAQLPDMRPVGERPKFY